MNKKLRIAGLLLSLAAMIALAFPASVAAEDPTPTPTPVPQEEAIDLRATSSKVEGTSGSSYQFEVKVNYTGGAKARLFDITATGPKDWDTYVTPSYPADKKIKDIQLDPADSYGQTLNVNTTPPYWEQPKPGAYEIKMELTSGDIRQTITLQAIVTAQYTLDITPTTELYSTTATAGKDNIFAIIVANEGTDTLHNIKLSSSKPESWSITFSTEGIETLEAGQTQTVDARITPPAKAIAGDYEITLSSSSRETTSHDVTVRVTVETPSVWGWAGVGIIAVVIVGLVFAMARFSRR